MSKKTIFRVSGAEHVVLTNLVAGKSVGMNETINAAERSPAIAELQARKREVEAAIARLIEDFASENDLAVEGASLEHDPVIMNQQGDILNKKIHYSVELRVWL